MLRSLRILILLIAAAGLTLAPAAMGAKKTKAKVTYPSVSKVSPVKAGIGDTLSIKGKNFRSGKGKTTVILKRDGGRAIFIKADKATKTSLSITLPAKLLPFLLVKEGKPQYTRFRVRILTAKFGKKYSATKVSPLIGPSASGVGDADDCDGDGVGNSKDADDDNDLLSDTEEARLGLQSCKRDTDGDGMSDGWEQFSAIDRNGGSTKPAPTRRSYPNALDGKDGAVDSDGDGLSNLDEYTAWATFGGNKVPLSYSGGNPASAGRYKVPDELAYMDQDGNGFLSDFERDADGDGIPNKDEMRGSHNAAGYMLAGWPADTALYWDYGIFTDTYIKKAAEQSKQDTPLCAGINQVPWYCVESATDGGSPLEVSKVDTLDWLDADSDGDTIRDDQDDVDHDDIPNLTEYLTEVALPFGKRKYGPLNACVPNSDSRFCLVGTVDVDKDNIANRDDSDDDGDQIPDDLEAQIGTDPLLYDTDRDGVSDYFEYKSALDLNSAAVPYPGKRPYPNPLDKSDADLDFDQDSLTQTEEYKAWLKTGAPSVLTYSDGAQWTGGRVPPTGPFAGMDQDGDGTVSDDEKDVDGDGLSNYDETHGPLSSPTWWDKWAQKQCGDEYVESPYPGPAYLGMNFVDPDTDGDGVKDGADDIDHDGYTNAAEAYRPNGWCTTYISTGPYLMAGPHDQQDDRVQPFNPCKPVYSQACHRYPPFDYYKDNEDWASPIRP
ncbi:MAG: hypothetical protein HZB46_14530 [Solirubrobacterales bacterium]|nr:hypothetical protein [Solirubrobacterales bacterium]